jgi:hypothetical protein
LILSQGCLARRPVGVGRSIDINIHAVRQRFITDALIERGRQKSSSPTFPVGSPATRQLLVGKQRHAPPAPMMLPQSFFPNLAASCCPEWRN